MQVWIKPNGEMPFLYGNHVLKAHLGRITEDTPEHQGVVVFSMSDVPLVSLILFSWNFNLMVLVAGFWCNSAVNGRYEEARSNSYHSFPPGVGQAF